jgi:acetyltransferase-like isoleucine patch superfamily enzyme
MLFATLIRNICSKIVHDFGQQYHLAKIQTQYPTCKFYSGVVVENSSFEGYNVLFKNVVVSSCFLGSHSYVQKKSTLFNAEIGRFCSIASSVSIGPGMHKTDGVSTHPAFYLKNTPLVKVFSKIDMIPTSSKVNIGHDVWIGERAIILDGVTIGSGAIIAAGSVVNKDVEPYSIVGGVPAKHIKFRYDEKIIEILLKSQWWNFPETWFDENIELMNNVTKFIERTG